MKTFSVLSSALLLASSVAANAVPKVAAISRTPISPVITQKSSDGNCFVTLEAYASLQNFRLDIKTDNAIDTTSPKNFLEIRNPLEYRRDHKGSPGSFTPKVGGNKNESYDLKLVDGILKLMIFEKIPSPLAYVVIPRDRSIYRQIKFVSNAEIPAKFYASKRCKNGVTWLELSISEPNDGVFCSVDKNLYIKSISTPDSLCKRVHPIIHINTAKN